MWRSSHLSSCTIAISRPPASSVTTSISIWVSITSVPSIGVWVSIPPSSLGSVTTWSTPSSTTHLLLGSHLLDLDNFSIDSRLTLFYQLLCSIFPCKCYKCKCLRLIVLHLVDRPDHLNHGAELLKVGLQVFLGESLSGGELANIDLALPCLSLLTSHLFSLYNMSCLFESCIYSCQIFENYKGKSSGSSSHRVHLQVDILNLSISTKVLLDVCILCFLWKGPDKEFAIILVDCIGCNCCRFSSHFRLYSLKRIWSFQKSIPPSSVPTNLSKSPIFFFSPIIAILRLLVFLAYNFAFLFLILVINLTEGM